MVGKKKTISKKGARTSPKKVVNKSEKTVEKKAPPPKVSPEMKATTKILQEAYIRQTLIELGGENALAIIRNFYSNHSDEELAKKLKIKISDVRATLNKLHNVGLVNYNRQKDNETGWYSYSWSLNHDKMAKWATDQTTKIEGLEDGNEKYYCPSCGEASITDFENASVEMFKCSQCERMLEFLDKEKMIEMYERKRF